MLHERRLSRSKIFDGTSCKDRSSLSFKSSKTKPVIFGPKLFFLRLIRWSNMARILKQCEKLFNSNKREKYKLLAISPRNFPRHGLEVWGRKIGTSRFFIGQFRRLVVDSNDSTYAFYEGYEL